ncbi:MAG: molybdopterin-dependent oxidoreductase [Ghiorsea sp.]|nr:molybdopterin-dependent oxidoreductase [Ghiorsea sp.]
MTTTVNSVCSYCGTGCGIVLETDGEKIISLLGDSKHPTNQGKLCSKGRELHKTVDTKDRLLVPQLRTSLDAPFAPVDWDSALSHTAKKFADIIQEHGPDAVAFYVSGQLLTEDYYVFNKLMKGFIGSNNIDTNSRLCMSSAVMGYKRAFGADGPPTCYDDIEKASCFFIAGANPAYAHPIVFRRLEAAKEANPNLKVIVVDPRRTDTCSIADLHLPLKAGTDVLLYQAMLHVLLQEGFADEDYMAKHTTGFAEVREKALNLNLGEAAETCGLTPEDIIQAARWFGENKTLSLWTMGLNQSSSGTDKNNALINLHLATGQVGKEGCGPFSLTGQPNAMGGREVGGMATMLAAHRDYTNPKHRQEVADYWGVDSVPEKPGLTATELFSALEAGTVKAVWIACTNPMVSMPDAKRAEAALRKAELVMVSDAYHPTDTTKLAHVLFPASGWAEKEGTITNTERRITHLQQAIPKAGLSRDDWKIAADFAVALGQQLGQDWSQAFAYQTASDVFDEHCGLTAGKDIDITGLSYAVLDKFGPQQWPFKKGDKPNQIKRLYMDHVYETHDKKAHFIDVDYIPVAEPTDDTYPLSLTTGRIRDQWHTMTKSGAVPQLMQHIPMPTLQIHPDDAQMYGIEDEALVLISSRRGEVIAPAQISKDIRQGLVFFPMHWGKMMARAGRINTLMKTSVDPVSKEPEFKHSAVNVLPFKAAWHGMLLMAGQHVDLGQQMIEPYTYGVVACAGQNFPVTSIDLACTQPLKDEQYKRLDYILEQGQAFEVLTYSDKRHGIHRKAWINSDGHLVAVRWVGGDISEAKWLRTLMLEGTDVGDMRPFLLAPSSVVNTKDTKGKIICACHNVGEIEIKEAIASGCGDLETLKTCTKAGTGCGSCVPEMKRLLT